MVTGVPSWVLIQVSMPIRSGAGPQLASAAAADWQVTTGPDTPGATASTVVSPGADRRRCRQLL